MARGHSSLAQSSPCLVTHGIGTPKTKPTKSHQQDSPVQCMPLEQTPQQPTAGLSGTQWLEDLIRKPSQHDEPPIPGPSPSSKPPEDVLTSCPATPRLVIIIDDMPVGSPPSICPSTPVPPPSHCHQESNRLLPPVPSSSHSYNEALQDFINLQPTLMIP
ncbi:hypothetical protein O181_047988 [Austropuccinia psidii MF-1]|uniref:Uncharacterized protein n=1 Tax=Austropuccinia psidii MF-1 TaxID=1389203 RepID=A0A9Q3DX45_9BASI|nr:hypothetical protein [Austropuccinia psidii MF-1]